jgi:hypothetical protein
MTEKKKKAISQLLDVSELTAGDREQLSRA